MIDGIKVRIRGLELKDADTIHKNWNSLELRAFLGSRTPNSLEDEQDYVRSSWKGNPEGKLSLGIELIDTGELIGTVGIWLLWQFSGSFELGIAIWEKKFHSKGYGTEAIQLMLFYGFDIVDVRRVQLHVVEFNHRAIKSYLKIGFKEVGRLRKAEYIFGKRFDLVLMDLLKDEMKYPDELLNELNKYKSLTTLE